MTRSKARAPAAPQAFRLAFEASALREWQALDGSVKEPLRKLLKKRLESPSVPGADLHGELRDCYKIKLRQQGWRLVYQVVDDLLIVLVLAVDKRENAAVYSAAIKRLRGVGRAEPTPPSSPARPVRKASPSGSPPPKSAPPPKAMARRKKA